jgi:protein CpxP
MNMKKTITRIALLAGIASATAFGSHFAQADEGGKSCHEYAEQHHHHGHHFMHRRFEKMAAKLGLSEQQKVKIKEVFKQNREQAKPILDRLITEKRNMRTLVQADKTDEAAIRAQAAKLAAVEGDMAIQRAHMAKQIRAILTPEQIEKFKAMQKERQQKFEKFREHHGKKQHRTGTEK